MTSENITRMLPVQSLDELETLLESVKFASINYIQLKEYIELFCGDDFNKSVKRILDNLIDKSVQKQVSWSGLRTSKPSLVKDYKQIVDAVNEVLRSKFSDFNFDRFERKVSTLLRGL